MGVKFGFIVSVFVLAGCGSSKSDSPAAADSAAWTEAKVILDASCASCHTATSTNYTNCGNFMTSEATYKVAQACASAANRPSARIALTTSLKMPPSTTLTAAQITTLTALK